MIRAWRAVRSRPRLIAGAAAGLVSLPVLPGAWLASTRGLVAWDVGVLSFLGLSAQLFATAAPSQMPAAAEAQEEGEWTIFAMTLAVVSVSFAAVGTQFAAIKDDAGQRGWYVALIAVTLLVSWLMTHVTFAFRYAHEYYADDEGGPEIDRGLEFPGENEPDYWDFLYFALVLGMTFQVSDVPITSRKLRRVATVHGLLSFLFNTVIVALTVNLAAPLMG